MAQINRDDISNAVKKAIDVKRYKLEDGTEVERPAVSEIREADRIRRELEAEAAEESGGVFMGEQIVLRRLS